MLSYRHAFHAGNHADVLKHVVLLMLARAMLRKESSFRYLDTHAGGGGYDLSGEYAQKNAEFEGGIGRLWGLEEVPAEVADYLERVRAFNGPGALQRYPGSPLLLASLLRPQDAMVLCELHGSELPPLREAFAGDRRVQVHAEDGFQGLKAFVPPREKRLLALIDPPFELDNEYSRTVHALSEAHRRFATGVYAVWYPVLTRHKAEAFTTHLAGQGIRRMLRVELDVRDDRSGRGMKGSGLVIVNPPWQLDERLQALLPWLWQHLSEEGQGGTRLEWLVPE